MSKYQSGLLNTRKCLVRRADIRQSTTNNFNEPTLSDSSHARTSFCFESMQFCSYTSHNYNSIGKLEPSFPSVNSTSAVWTRPKKRDEFLSHVFHCDAAPPKYTLRWNERSFHKRKTKVVVSYLLLWEVLWADVGVSISDVNTQVDYFHGRQQHVVRWFVVRIDRQIRCSLWWLSPCVNFWRRFSLRNWLIGLMFSCSLEKLFTKCDLCKVFYPGTGSFEKTNVYLSKSDGNSEDLTWTFYHVRRSAAFSCGENVRYLLMKTIQVDSCFRNFKTCHYNLWDKSPRDRE